MAEDREMVSGEMVSGVPSKARAQRPVRIGIEVDDVVLDWGLHRAGVEDLRNAVTVLLDGRVGGLKLPTCAELVRRARAIDPRRLIGNDCAGRIEPSGLAAAFGLTLRQRAVLVELKFAAFAQTPDELRGHLDHALVRLAGCIQEAKDRDYEPTPGVVAALNAAAKRQVEGGV